MAVLEEFKEQREAWDRLDKLLEMEDYMIMRRVARVNPNYYETSSEPKYLLSELLK